MSKHTPGPWVVKFSTGTMVSVGPARGVSVACVGNADEADTQANARLIAAAPAMLNKLKEAERTLRWAAQEASGKVKAEIVGGWIYHADDIHAAIAKAEGGEA